MGYVKLELRCPKSVGTIAVDPQPDWSFESLLSEITAIEIKLYSPSPLTKVKVNSRDGAPKNDSRKKPGAFSIHISDDELYSEDDGQSRTVGKRFACDELHITSDGEDHEEESQYELMSRVGLVEAGLRELNHEHQLNVTEDVRNKVLGLVTDLVNENAKLSNGLAQIEKEKEARRDMDRKLDMQYQRRIAVELDNHLTTVQRDHEHKSQMEERRIRDDAAYEESKRKEQALREEKLRQLKLKAEMEARIEAEKKRDEEAKAAAAALEAKKKAEKDSADAAALASLKEVKESEPDKQKKVQLTEQIIKGAVGGLKLEESRSQIYKELVARNESFGVNSNKELRSHGMKIARMIKTITGTKESVRTKADELIKLLTDPTYPQTYSVFMFAEKFVSQCANPIGSFSNIAYAYAQVIVLVTSKVPIAMDILLAELNRVCMYTVPKYISYSESAFESKEAYCKAIGYLEEDGKIEEREKYVERISSYMKLYGALVQTEAEGGENLHGISAGWAWIARFLNNLPANLYTAVALEGFLQMAGFAMYRKYKGQFRKILKIISENFMKALREKRDEKLDSVVMRMKTYLESNQFTKEPEGWRLQANLKSREEAFKDLDKPDNHNNDRNYDNYNRNNDYNNNSYYNNNQYPPARNYTYRRT